MIERINNLDTFELTNNMVLIAGGLDYNWVEIPGPNGTKVQLEIMEIVKGEPEKKCITGTVLKTPERLLFHGELKTHKRGQTIDEGEFTSLMRESMPHDVDMNVKVGDKVIFDYKQALSAEVEGDCRLLDVEGHGYCMLMPYESLFAKEVDGQLVPLNGWVFFVRDQEQTEQLLKSGLWLVEKEDKYRSNYGTVKIADNAVREYLDKNHHEPDIELNPGQRIYVQNKFGYRIAADRYAGQLIAVEAIRRKNILCLLD